MFGFIRSISLATQVMIPVFGLILFVAAWFAPGNLQPGDSYGNGFFYLPAEGLIYSFWQKIAAFPQWVQILPSFLVALVTAILLVSNDLRNLLMGRRSFAVAFVFLFLIGSSGYYPLFHPAFLAGMLMVMSQGYLLNLYKQENEYSHVFAVGFTWGVAIILYPPALFHLVAMLAGLLLMVGSGWRHWLVIILGLALPSLIACAGFYLTGDLGYEIDTFLSWFQWRDSILPSFLMKDQSIAIWLGVIFLWIVVASIRYRNPRIQSRQLFLSNFLLFISILLSAVFLESVSTEFLWLITIPVSYLMTYWALEAKKGWLRTLFFLSLVVLFAWFRFSGLLGISF